MPSLIPGYEYDIFISYRHNDNHSGWVTEFVKNLQEELAATIKEQVSVYFDVNPHDGLLETHDVDKSVEGKLKCLIFIPVISQTYCDPGSFAWKHEFCAFNKMAKEDRFGRDIKLATGNVSSRILPVRIHDLDADDLKFLKDETGGVLRAIEFIYKEPGVNRPLKPNDEATENLNKTKYQNQINKAANAIKEILSGLKNFGKPGFYSHSDEKFIGENKSSEGQSIVVLPFENMGPEKDQGLKTSHQIIPSNQRKKSDAFFSSINAEDKKSIAVLPFVNMSKDPEQEYFCDGLAEELINALTRINNLRVVARTSAFSFKGKEVDIRSIGGQLGVETILEGSVRRTGNRLRITAQLINIDDGCHLWSERYDRDLTDVFAIQDEIALKIVEKFSINLAGQEKTLVLKRHTENVEAHAFYLKGRHFGWLFTEEGFKKSEDYFHQAVEKDSGYALAYAGLADLYSLILIFGRVHPGEPGRKARFYAEKALSLDETLAEAHLSLALVKMFADWNWNEAGMEFKHALELGPGSSVIHLQYSIYPMVIGKPEEAVAAARRAVDLDPLSSAANQYLGFILWTSGRFDESLEQSRKALELNPGHAFAQLVVAWSYAFKGMYQEAIAECEKAIKLYAEFDPWFHTSIACIYAMADKKAYALDTLDKLNELSKTKYIDPWNFAVLYAWLGEHENALQWLEKACNEHSGICYFVKANSALWFKPISADPRFTAILKKMGLVPEDSVMKQVNGN